MRVVLGKNFRIYHFFGCSVFRYSALASLYKHTRNSNAVLDVELSWILITNAFLSTRIKDSNLE
jgi:hypothetical protein